jgi:hypothetical protein
MVCPFHNGIAAVAHDAHQNIGAINVPGTLNALPTMIDGLCEGVRVRQMDQFLPILSPDSDSYCEVKCQALELQDSTVVAPWRHHDLLHTEQYINETITNSPAAKEGHLSQRQSTMRLPAIFIHDCFCHCRKHARHAVWKQLSD